MKRIKKASIIICVVIMLVSALAVPVSAASNDRYHTFEWEGTQRFASTPYLYEKDNNSATYFRVVYDTMPLEGFYIATRLKADGEYARMSSPYFLVTTYGGKTIQHDQNAAGKYAGLTTKYPSSHWSWGNVTVAWSEDYVEDGSERLNW